MGSLAVKPLECILCNCSSCHHLSQISVQLGTGFSRRSPHASWIRPSESWFHGLRAQRFGAPGRVAAYIQYIRCYLTTRHHFRQPVRPFHHHVFPQTTFPSSAIPFRSACHSFLTLTGTQTHSIHPCVLSRHFRFAVHISRHAVAWRGSEVV